MSKPVVLAVGSCLIDILGEGFLALCSNENRFEFVAPKNVPNDRPRVAGGVLGRCVLVIEEASPWKKYHALSDEERALLPASCVTLRIPTIHFNSLWPLMVRDPRNTPEPQLPWGKIPFAFGDRLVLHIRRNEPRERWLSAYRAADPAQIVNIKRNHELELGDMFAREQGCDVQVASYVAANFRRRRLFYTHHHPTPELMTFALVQVLANSAAAHLFDRPVTAAVDAAPEWVASRNPLFGEEAPIHPSVARFFALEWYRDDLAYRWLGKTFSFEEWSDFNLHYEPNLAPDATTIE